MRELVTVHQVGRAVSTVVDLEQVLRSVVDEVLNVLGGKTAAIALAVEGRVRRARRRSWCAPSRASRWASGWRRWPRRWRRWAGRAARRRSRPIPS